MVHPQGVCCREILSNVDIKEVFIILQSSYFSSMFSGNWKESSESQVTLNIPDPHITVEGMLI